MKQLIKFFMLILVFMNFVGTIGSAPEMKATMNENGGYNYSRKFEKSYDVDPRSNFVLENQFGDAIITAWNQNKVSVVAEIKASAEDREFATEFGEQIKIEVTQTPAELRIETIIPDRQTYKTGWFKRRSVSYSVDCVINIPATMSADLNNFFGKLSASGIQGALKAKTNQASLSISNCSNVTRLVNQFADIRVYDIGGKEIDIDNSNGGIEGKIINATANFYNRFGKVEVQEVKGDLMIDNSNGDVFVVGVTGKARVTNRFGAIDLKNIGGEVKVNSGNGPVRIKDVAGGLVHNRFGEVRILNTTQANLGVNVDNGNGDIFVESIKGNATLSTSFAHIEALDVTGNVIASAGNSSIQIINPGGTVEADNSFGSVKVMDAPADVRISNSNGSIELVAAKVGKNYRLRTSFAPIKLTFPSGLSAAFLVETSFGEIETDFPLKIKKTDNSRSLEGTIGDGAARIDIKNSNGSVYIRQR